MQETLCQLHINYIRITFYIKFFPIFKNPYDFKRLNKKIELENKFYLILKQL